MDEQAEVHVEVPPNAGASADGFESFLRDGYDRLLGALYLATGNLDEARDLTQEAYSECGSDGTVSGPWTISRVTCSERR